MQILYGATGAGSVAPQALLTHLEVGFELKLISFDDNEHQSPEFLAVNPRGQIPALVLDDGSVLTESLAIMLHVADCHPACGLSPPLGSVERAQVYRWMSFVATNLYEGLLRILYPDMYTTATDPSKVAESADQYVRASLGILDDALGVGPYLVGGRASVADIYLAMLLTWYPDQSALYQACPNLHTALRQTLTLKGVSEVFAENELV
jgi:glutathione S-transferase/GST-like protein